MHLILLLAFQHLVMSQYSAGVVQMLVSGFQRQVIIGHPPLLPMELVEFSLVIGAHMVEVL
jgi:hypothetical protein